MGNKHRTLREYLYYAAFFFAAIWLLTELRPVLFAVHDDLRNYVLVRRGLVAADAWRMATGGRISHLWNHFLLALPFLANKVWFYRLIRFGALLFDIFSLRLLLKTHSDRRLADLASVLALAWACMSDQHNLLVAFALCHQLPFGFACLSLYHFGNRLQKNNRRDAFRSCLFLLLSVMIYEAFAAVLILMLLWAMMRRTRKPLPFLQWLRRAARRIVPQAVTVGCYGVVYCIWQKIFPAQYDGVTLDMHEPFLSISTLTGFSLGNFPLSEISFLAGKSNVTVSAVLGVLHNPLAWLTAALAAALFCVTLPRVHMSDEALHNLLWISGVGIFVPCIAIAFSEKYLEWRHSGVRAYLPSFYSYLILVVFLTAAAVRLFRAAPDGNRRRLLRGCMTAAVFALSLTASTVNGLWKPHFTALLQRYRTFDQAVSATLPALSGAWQLYAPDNPGIHNDQAYSEDYLQMYSDSRIPYLTEASALSDQMQTLCIRMPEDYAFTVSGTADSLLRAKTLTFRTLLPEGMDITLYDTDGNALNYENVKNGNILSLPEGRYFDLSVRVKYTQTRENEEKEALAAWRQSALKT